MKLWQKNVLSLKKGTLIMKLASNQSKINF